MFVFKIFDARNLFIYVKMYLFWSEKVFLYPNAFKKNIFIVFKNIIKKKFEKNFFYQFLLIFTIFWGVSDKASSRTWPASVRDVQIFFCDLSYRIWSSKKILVMFWDVKGTFPKKVDPPQKTSIFWGGSRVKISLNPLCFEQLRKTL